MFDCLCYNLFAVKIKEINKINLKSNFYLFKKDLYIYQKNKKRNETNGNLNILILTEICLKMLNLKNSIKFSFFYLESVI